MRKILFNAGLLLLLTATSCSRSDFAELNTDPEGLQPDEVDVKTLFPVAQIAMHGNDFEAYYDIHRNIQYWSNTWIPLGGNGTIATRFTTPSAGGSKVPYRYDDLYSRETMGVGGTMIEMRSIIDKMPAAQNATFQHIRAITYIPEAYAAFFLSDITGSIAYTDAFKARYTSPSVLRPKFDTQEALFDSLDKRLKASVAILKQTLPVAQEILGASDMYFHGKDKEAANWAMAANSLRLRLAMRILKRKPDAAKAIILEVLADNIGPISSRAGNWVFKGGPTTATGGNYGLAAGLSGQKALIDFMYTTGDPRIRNIYQKVRLTQRQFDTLKARGTVPATEVYQEYRGRYTSLDLAGDPKKNFYFNYLFGDTAYVSYIQYGMFNADTGPGLVNFPVITYADVCLMRAELAARGITTEVAVDWYNKGIEASIADYDEWGKDAKVIGYSAMTPTEVTAYKTKVAYDATKGIEQICIQQFINFYRNPNESWAVFKRTGYPSPTGQVMQAERVMNGGEVTMPRRWALSLPPVTDLNYENKRAALLEMQKDPNLKDLSDITGRVWWDMP